MARYTDIDKLIDKVEETDWYHISKQGELAIGANSKDDIPLYKASDIKDVLLNAPISDVAPRSEIIRWRLQLEAVLEEIPETKREVAMEIFEEIEKAIYHTAFNVPESVIRFRNKIAELKKKYTEGKK